MKNFVLDERLKADSVSVGDWPLCRVLLMRDARYPWYVLVPRKPGLRELCELNTEESQQFLQESRELSQFLLQALSAEKLNVAALGNMVPQLHIHHIARYADDAAWPGPIWGAHPALSYPEAELKARLELTRRALNL